MSGRVNHNNSFRFRQLQRVVQTVGKALQQPQGAELGFDFLELWVLDRNVRGREATLVSESAAPLPVSQLPPCRCPTDRRSAAIACWFPRPGFAPSAARPLRRLVSPPGTIRLADPRTTGWDAVEHAVCAQILVDVRPVHTVTIADQHPVRPRLRSRRRARVAPRPSSWLTPFDVRDRFSIRLR